jgi:sporulation protein YlmC with PRC-barrel domain
VLELTECLGADVVDARGARVGKLIDLAARLDDPYPIVSRLRVRMAHRSVRYVEWATIASFTATVVELSVRAEELQSGDTGADSPRTDELLLAEHVLDTQIIDVKGKRVVRVGEVELASEGANLLVVGVEVGRAALVRRLGLRRFVGRIQSELVDWRDLHVASGRGHALQLRTAHARVHRLSASELAHLVSRMPLTSGADVLRTVRPRAAAGALDVAHPELGGRLVGELDPRQAAPILVEMPADRAANTVRHLKEDQQERVLAAVPTQHAEELRQILIRPPEPVAGPTPVRRRFRRILSARRRAPS